MALVEGQPPVLLEKVSEIIHKKMPADRADIVDMFAKRLYRTIAADDLKNRDESTMYGSVVGLWHSFAKYEANSKAIINIYNPEVSKHGWESPHTIVEIIQSDIPFTADSVPMALNRHKVTAHLLLHTPLAHKRDKQGKVIEILPAGESAANTQVDTVFLIEIDRQSDPDVIDALQKELASVMEEVTLAVADWRPMRARLEGIAEELKTR